MTATKIILALLAERCSTRHELQTVTGYPQKTLESALYRLCRSHQIEVRPIPVERCGIGTRPGIWGRPRRPAVVYAKRGVRFTQKVSVGA